MTDMISNPDAVSGVPNTNDITTRTATREDAAWVENLHERAFGPGRFARAAFRVREHLPIDKKLSLLAEADGRAIGAVWMTPISLSGENGYLLGPLAIDPNFQNRGAGKKLIYDVCRMALDGGAGSYVLLVGDEAYYRQLGFEPARPGAIQFPGPVDPARILVYARDPSITPKLAGGISPFKKDKI